MAKKFGISGVLLAGAVKPLVSNFLKGYVGDGNIVSGVVKIAAGKYIGKSVPAWLRMALMVDGAEDIMIGLMSGSGLNLGSVFGGGTAQGKMEVI